MSQAAAIKSCRLSMGKPRICPLVHRSQPQTEILRHPSTSLYAIRSTCHKSYRQVAGPHKWGSFHFEALRSNSTRGSPQKYEIFNRRYTSIRPYREYQPNRNAGDFPRTIHYAFDPVGEVAPKPTSGLFSFLHQEHVRGLPEFHHTRCIIPSSLGVPWDSSFPSSLQSKYWVEAEAAASGFLREIYDRVPNGRVDNKYVAAVVDAAVSFAVNVTPMGDLARMELLSKTAVMFIILDDLFDESNVKGSTQSDISSAKSPGQLGYEMLAKEMHAEDEHLGEPLLSSILAWKSFQTQDAPAEFPNFDAYVIYRVQDSGAAAVFRCVQFACNSKDIKRDSRGLTQLELLCAKHFALTNDPYSYAKEVVAEKQQGEPVINAVRVIECLMNVRPEIARTLLRWIILDLEKEIGQEYEHLSQTGSISPDEQKYARGLMVSITGNMFFSATSARYTRAVEDSKLPISG